MDKNVNLQVAIYYKSILTSRNNNRQYGFLFFKEQDITEIFINR